MKSPMNGPHTRERSDRHEIHADDAHTRAVTQVTAFRSGSGYLRYPAWSPSGTRLVFERALESGSVWTMRLR